MESLLATRRSMLLTALEMAKLSEHFGKAPWTLSTNVAYDLSSQTSLTVVITLSNGADTIQRCFNSIDAAVTENIPDGFDVLIIDDCSTDDSVALAEAYLRRSSIPVALVKKLFNTGLADTRNIGLKLARAPFVFILDATHWIYPNCLSQHYDAITTSGAAAVYGMVNRCDRQTGEGVGLRSCYDWNVQELLTSHYLEATALFKRDILLQLGYSTELVGLGGQGWEDYDLWLKLAQAGHTAKFIPQILSVCQVQSGSIAHAHDYSPALAEYLKQKFARLIAAHPNPHQLFGYPRHLESAPSPASVTAPAAPNPLIPQLREVREQLERSRQYADQIRGELGRAKSRIAAMETSKFWQIRLNWFKWKRSVGLSYEDIDPFQLTIPEPPEFKALPPVPQPQPTPPPKVAAPDPYTLWMDHHTPKPDDLKHMATIAEVLGYKPLISLVLVVFNPSQHGLQETIDSVLQQVYPHWDLCIIDNAANPDIRAVLEDYAATEARIRVVVQATMEKPASCINAALQQVTGEFVALLHGSDRLAPEALYEMAFLLNRKPDADMIYSDEDKIDEQGKRFDPFFKPNWCPDSFLSRMYTRNLALYRRSRIMQLGGLREEFEESYDYDLVLRLTETSDQIYHLPKVLYHQRVDRHSAHKSLSLSRFPSAELALTEALQRRGEPGVAKPVPEHPGFHIIRYEIADPKLVSIIIPTRDLGRVLNQCLESVFTKSTYPNFEVILIDNGSTEPYTEKIINHWLNQEPDRFRCYALNIPFNYSKINNYAVAKARGDYLLFLNNDTEVINADWIEAMVEQVQRPSVGMVGARLLYSDDTIQHAGVVMFTNGADHILKFLDATDPGYFGQLLSVNNYSAVTGACMMCRREVFEAVGGFEEELAVAFNDIDLCLKIDALGLRNICLPHVQLYHYESKSRGMDDTPEKQARANLEAEFMRRRWRSIMLDDPCYNPHLTRCRLDYSIRIPDKATEPQVQALRHQLERTRTELKHLETQLQETQTSLAEVQREKQRAIARVEAMETSKFWKLRSRWFKLRRLVRVPGQE